MLSAHFDEFIVSLGTDPRIVEADLRAQYAVPERTYHTLDGHIRDGFEELWQHRERAQELESLLLAWLCHDAVYDTRRHDNEELSAAYVRSITWRLDLSTHIQELSSSLVLITKHDGGPATNDDELIIGADLAILGKPRDEFIRYEAGIRQEYSWVHEEIFRRERIRILEGFLKRSAIYTHDAFRGYEARARENLRWSVARLREERER